MKLWMNVADAAEYAGLSGDTIFKKSWVLTVLKAHEVVSPPPQGTTEVGSATTDNY